MPSKKKNQKKKKQLMEEQVGRQLDAIGKASQMVNK